MCYSRPFRDSDFGLTPPLTASVRG